MEALCVTCAVKDAMYLKYLFLQSYEQKPIKHGVFIPAGLHLLTSPQVYKALLTKHNHFLANFACTPVMGLSRPVFQTSLSLDGPMLADKATELQLFKTFEPTNKTHKLGKWFFTTTKDLLPQAWTYLDETLCKLFISIPKSMHVHGFNFPHHPSQPAMATPVGTYMATLLKLVNTSNPPHIPAPRPPF